jgi:Holliday junction resolvase-like predicted endonuclease
MKQLAVWQVSKGSLVRADDAVLELERNLEAWIAEDPDLLQNGLTIVGRQVQLEAGSLDLLGLDPQGRWVAIELKRGALDRKTIAQVQDYAACLSTITGEELKSKTAAYLAKQRKSLDSLLEERSAMHSLDPQHRQVLLMVAGTGRAPGLERLVSYLAEKLPISVLLFHVFRLRTGELLLAREITEQDNEPESSSKSTLSLSTPMDLAKRHGIYESLHKAVEIARELGLQVRPYKTSVMFTPPSNGSRMLFTVWAKPEKGKIKAYVGVEPFTEFFPLRRPAVAKQIGPEGWRTFSRSSFSNFLKAVYSLISAAKTESRGA